MSQRQPSALPGGRACTGAKVRNPSHGVGPRMQKIVPKIQRRQPREQAGQAREMVAWPTTLQIHQKHTALLVI